MAEGRRRGQIKPRGDRWLVSIFLSSEIVKGHRVKHYRSETVAGSRKQAERRLTKLLGEKDDYRVTQPSRETFGKFVARWLEDDVKSRVRASTFSSYQEALKRYALPELEHVRLDRLGPATLQRVVSRLVARGLSVRTIKYTLALVGAALSTARRWRIIAFNPMSDVTLPRQQRRELSLPGKDVRVRLLAELQADTHWPLWCVLATTGLRPGEALGLQWADVDLDAGRLAVRRSLSRRGKTCELTEPKTSAGRRSLPLPAETAAVLRAHRAQQLAQRLELGALYVNRDLVFADPLGQPADWHNLRARHFRRACTRAALTCGVCGKALEQDGAGAVLHREDPEVGHAPAPALELLTFRPYDLRHLFASVLLAGKVDLKTLSVLLGHSNAGFTLATYVHDVGGTAELVAQVAGEAVFGEASGSSDGQSDGPAPPRILTGLRK
jgi:integrase